MAALGEAQQRVATKLNLSERTDEERNALHSEPLGQLLQQVGCRAGECLFLSLEVSKLPRLRRVLLRLSEWLKTVVEGSSVCLHVDGQNPDPSSGHARVLLGTWCFYLAAEGEHCPVQVTGIVCDRASICNRGVNNSCVRRFAGLYEEGVVKFQWQGQVGGVRQCGGWPVRAGAGQADGPDAVGGRPEPPSGPGAEGNVRRG